MGELEHSPSLTLGIAFLAGVVCLVIARHLRMPGIVLLLVAGVVLGPDVLDLVRPNDLGDALPALVNFGVAIILFEGGLNLDLRRLRREAPVIRRLVTTGAVTTAIGAAVCARLIMQWDWTLSILFGTLVIVTGPTVMAPLLRRIKVKRNVSTVLEAEGVLIDPIGAVIAIVTLEVLAAPSASSVGGGALGIVARLGFGLIIGGACGWLLSQLLRWRRAIPEGLENIVVLGFVVGTFQIAEALLPESGIMAVTMAGFVVGNMRTPVHRDLQEFKEQLTLLLIGLLFVLLAAFVRLETVQSLGWRGAITVLCLMFLVRPLDVAVSTVGISMPWNERAFLAWLAPRGIIAAAVASHFAHVLHMQGRDGGEQLLAMVFLVIAMTVVIQGVTGGPVASLLGVRLPAPVGTCILGANKLARTVARALVDTGVEVTLIDMSSHFVQEAEDEGLRVVFGNGLEERTMLRARIDTMATCAGLTPNEVANLMFVRHAIEEFKVRDCYVALRAGHGTVTEKKVEEVDARLLFGRSAELERWYVRLERDMAAAEWWEWSGALPESASAGDDDEESEERDAAPEWHRLFPSATLPVVWQGEKGARLFDMTTTIAAGDRMCFVIYTEDSKGEDFLREHGWQRVDGPAGAKKETAAPTVAAPVREATA